MNYKTFQPVLLGAAFGLAMVNTALEADMPHVAPKDILTCVAMVFMGSQLAKQHATRLTPFFLGAALVVVPVGYGGVQFSGHEGWDHPPAHLDLTPYPVPKGQPARSRSL